MKQSQLKFVENFLMNNNLISRNLCLQNFISRLGAIVNILNHQGWEIKGHYAKTDKGKDYIYEVIKCPYEKKSYYVPELGKTIEKYEKVKDSQI